MPPLDTRKAVLAAQLARDVAKQNFARDVALGNISPSGEQKFTDAWQGGSGPVVPTDAPVPTPRPTNMANLTGAVGNPRGYAGVGVPNSPDPERMRAAQELMKQAGPMGNLNLDVPLPNSPAPKMMQEGEDMRNQNSILESVQAQGLDAWNRIKAGKPEPYDAQTLAAMVSRGLDGGAPEGDWPKMIAATKHLLPKR